MILKDLRVRKPVETVKIKIKLIFSESSKKHIINTNILLNLQKIQPKMRELIPGLDRIYVILGNVNLVKKNKMDTYLLYAQEKI